MISELFFKNILLPLHLWIYRLRIDRTMDTNEAIRIGVEMLIINEDLSPNICIQCGSTEYEDVITDSIEGAVLERQRKCKYCRTTTGYWAHGQWLP